MYIITKHFSELSKEELYEILRIRVAVFVVEQNCPYQELDNCDQDAYHVMVYEGDHIEAYLRVFRKDKEVRIGRVLSVSRKKGYGKTALQAGIEVAKENYQAKKIVIEAQTYAKEFYEKVGFKQSSEEFLEDGIPHIQMTLTL